MSLAVGPPETISGEIAVPVTVATTDRPSSLLVLQLFAWLTMLLPARLVIGQIGAFGSPASIVGLVAFGLWLSGAVRPGLLVRVVVPARLALAAVWIPGLIAYAVLHLNSVPGDEVNAADRWLLFMLVWTGVALLGAETLRDRSDVFRLMRVIVAGASCSALVALFQSRFGFDLTTYAAKIPGLSVAGELQSVLARSGLRRPAGTATHPIEFGCMLAMVLGPALVLAIYDDGWIPARRWGALCLIGLGIPIAVSRSAIIGAGIVGIFWFVGAEAKMRARGLVVVAVFGVFVFLTTPGLIGTLANYFGNFGGDESISTRTDDYAVVAPFIRHSPLIGRGPATFLPKFRILDNQWLATLIETGMLGLIGLALYYGSVGLLGLAIRRRSSDPMMRAMGLAFAGMSVVMIFSSTAFDFFAYPMDPAFLALFVGIAGALYGLTRPTRPTRPVVAVAELGRTAAFFEGVVDRVDAPPPAEPVAAHVATSAAAPSTLVPTDTSFAPPAPDPPGRSARGALKWSLIAQFVARAGSFALGLVIARLLTEEEVGVYTIALAVFLVLLTIDDLGISKGLIRWPGSFSDAAPTARTLGTISGVTIYVLVFIVAPFIATPAATGVIRLIAVAVLIDAAAQIVPGASLHRQLRQDLWIFVELTRGGVMIAVTIVLAVTDHGPSSLAWGTVCGQIAMTAVTMWLARVPVRFGFNRSVARELLEVSAPYALAALVGVVLLSADYFVIDNVLGTAAVGVYAVAFNVSSWPTTLVGAAVRAVAIPGLAQLHQRGQDIGPTFRRGLILLAGGSCLFAAVLIAAPELVIGTLYGDRWVAGSTALRFLALLAVVRVLDGLSDDALFALGRSRAIAVKNIVWVMFLIPALIIGTNVDGIRGAGVAHAVVACVMVLPLVAWLLRRVDLWGQDLMIIVTAVVPAALVAVVVGSLADRIVPGPRPVAVVLVGLVQSIVYVAALAPRREALLGSWRPTRRRS